MSNLKTLKDFDLGGCGSCEPEDTKRIREDLKQEAIKDIKFLEGLSKGSDEVAKMTDTAEAIMLEEKGFCLFDAMGAYDNSNVIEYIKRKFNITEEDLKGGDNET